MSTDEVSPRLSLLHSFDVKVEGRSKPIRTQVWATLFVGAQYLPGSYYIKHIQKQMNAIIKHADDIGVKIFGLGALNKAEWVNKGGDYIVDEVKPKFTKIVHGESVRMV